MTNAATLTLDTLSQQLATEIQRTGPMPFVEFMRRALYTPSLGYYCHPHKKLGAEGDFITAPELSPLFSKTLGRQCQVILETLGGGDILEFGAGTGKMAADILLFLEAVQTLPTRYFILEVSADLKARQQAHLQTICPQLYDRVVWLETQPTTPFQGVILANEVLDAMPVHRFHWEPHQFQEYYVDYQDAAFGWTRAPLSSSDLVLSLEALREYLETTAHYDSEINLWIKPWLAGINDYFKRGILLLIDYGFPAQTYYHPDRHMGTLMCHYQHRVHTDPLIHIGHQDISAHVDFTQVALAASALNFDVCGYTTQAGFLLSLHITDFLTPTLDTRERFIDNQALKQLTQAHEMGELFKVMALGRDYEVPLQGFSLRDMRHHL